MAKKLSAVSGQPEKNRALDYSLKGDKDKEKGGIHDRIANIILKPKRSVDLFCV